MTTIILTYRNRHTSIVRNCLDSLQNQNQMAFQDTAKGDIIINESDNALWSAQAK